MHEGTLYFSQKKTQTEVKVKMIITTGSGLPQGYLYTNKLCLVFIQQNTFIQVSICVFIYILCGIKPPTKVPSCPIYHACTRHCNKYCTVYFFLLLYNKRSFNFLCYVNKDPVVL